MSHKVSILTAVKDREEDLVASLASWSQIKGLRQIVIVDWSSENPIQIAIDSLEKKCQDLIEIIRVEGQQYWQISKALNVGLKKVKSEYVLKLDADHSVCPDIVLKNQPGRYHFHAGDWRRGEGHSNGSILTSRESLIRLKGWDERIDTYGWDDDDLYERLSLTGLSRRGFLRGSVKHREHSEALRVAYSRSKLKPKKSTKKNAKLSLQRIPWGGSGVDLPTPRSLRCGVIHRFWHQPIWGRIRQTIHISANVIYRILPFDKSSSKTLVIELPIRDDELLVKVASGLAVAAEKRMTPILLAPEGKLLDNFLVKNLQCRVSRNYTMTHSSHFEYVFAANANMISPNNGILKFFGKRRFCEKGWSTNLYGFPVRYSKVIKRSAQLLA